MTEAEEALFQLGQQVGAAFECLYRIEQASGSNAKKAELEKHRGNAVLRDLCFAAYGGDKYNAYPTIQFDDASDRPGTPRESEVAERGERYLDFRAILIKLRNREVTGDAAVELLNDFLVRCSSHEKKWYRRVLEHDLKVGAHRTFAKVWDYKTLSLEGTGPKAGVQFPGCMLCEPKEKYVEKFRGWLLVEPKLDGLRLVFVWEGGAKWSFFSRQGKSDRYNDNLKHIAKDLVLAMCDMGWESGIVDGEIMSESGWNATLAVKRKDLTQEDLDEIQKCRFYAFDHLTGPGDERKQKERRVTLAAICGRALSNNPDTKVSLIEQRDVETLDHAKSLFREFLEKGYEGVIVKDSETVYQFDNKRSKQWIKLKPVDTQDVRVLSRFEGKERTKYQGMLGGFHVIDQNGQEFKVGGGFTDEQRKVYWDRPEREFVGKWMEIEFQPDAQQVAKGRFPVFVRWREDLT